MGDHWLAVPSGRSTGVRSVYDLASRQLAQQIGRTFVVTGANSGIGLEASRDMVGRGAHVVLAVRDTAKVENAATRLAGPGSTSVVKLDLSDLDQVAVCAETLLARP